MSDLVQVVNQTDFNSEQFVSSMGASLQGSADAMLPDVVIFDLAVASLYLPLRCGRRSLLDKKKGWRP